MLLNILEQIKAIDTDNLIESECVGGGRVNIDQEKKSIFVYGYSQGNHHLIT